MFLFVLELFFVALEQRITPSSLVSGQQMLRHVQHFHVLKRLVVFVADVSLHVPSTRNPRQLLRLQRFANLATNRALPTNPARLVDQKSIQNFPVQIFPSQQRPLTLPAFFGGHPFSFVHAFTMPAKPAKRWALNAPAHLQNWKGTR